MQAFLPHFNASLGYLSRNCRELYRLGRVESFAAKNKVVPSIFDGIGAGLGFTSH
jgi:electron transport complex protein RnfE